MQHSHIQRTKLREKARFITGGVRTKQAEKLLYFYSALEMGENKETSQGGSTGFYTGLLFIMRAV